MEHIKLITDKNINEMTITYLESKIRDGEPIEVKTRANIVRRLPCFIEEQKLQVIKLLDLIPIIQ